MYQQQTLMLALFMTLGAALVGGLIMIPVVEEEVFADNGNHYGQIKNGNNGKHNGGGCHSCG